MLTDRNPANGLFRNWRRSRTRPEIPDETGEKTQAVFETEGSGVIRSTVTVEPFNVFSPAELQAARDRLNDGDPLHQLLARIGGE